MQKIWKKHFLLLTLRQCGKVYNPSPTSWGPPFKHSILKDWLVMTLIYSTADMKRWHFTPHTFRAPQCITPLTRSSAWPFTNKINMAFGIRVRKCVPLPPQIPRWSAGSRFHFRYSIDLWSYMKSHCASKAPPLPQSQAYDNYRPVTLKFVVMKSFESFMLGCQKSNTELLPHPLQFAFRTNWLGVGAVSMGLHFIQEHLNTKDPVWGLEFFIQHHHPSPPSSSS